VSSRPGEVIPVQALLFVLVLLDHETHGTRGSTDLHLGGL
jgi:hypothetical protein